MTIHNLPHEPVSNLYTDTPMREPPVQQANGNLEDGYFELSDSVSGPNSSTADVFPEKGLPPKISGRDSGVAALDEPIDRQSFESSGSSAPSDSAPPPPPKSSDRRTSLDEPHDIYDTPPVHQSQRHSLISESGAIYDCPPVQRRRPSEPVVEMDESEALYKQVPPPRRSVTSSIDFPVSPMKNGYEDSGPCDIYDVPPIKLPSTQQLYDTPPVNVKHEELSQSTDNLAKTFQNISFRNSMGNNSVNSDTFDLYDIPGSTDSQDRGPVSPPMDAAPPRPPKPSHMQNLDPATPPPSFDDTYNIPLNLQPQLNHADLTNRLSQEAQGHENYETPPSWNHSGHSWMDNSNGQSKPRYINTKRTESASGMPVNRPRSSLDGTIPAPSPNSYINTRNERYTFSPNQAMHSQSCYLPMQGNSNFEFDDSDPYMPMEGSIDGTADSYTFMQSPSGRSEPPPPIVPRSKSVSSARNSLGEVPPPIPRSMSTSSRSSRNSQGEIPPPVNRHSKPPIDRWSTSSSMSGISSPDLTAATGAGSFYATPEDAYEVQGSIVASPRTQSFSKKGMPMIPPPKTGESLRDSIIHENFRQRTNTGGSTTSSSGESGINPQESHYVTPTDGLRQPTISDEVYVYKDPPPVTPTLEKVQAAALQNQSTQAQKDPPTFESIAEANIPPPTPEKVEDAQKIEYLELDHTKNEEGPPPRPPKPADATTVEYFDLDPQKTRALQDVTAERQKNLSNEAP